MNAASSPQDIVCIDHRVPHVSTVPAIKGQTTDIFVREKFRSGSPSKHAPVLMVHGAFSPGTVAFDLDTKSYSWMDFLARAGFDVFSLDLTGYGFSARPMMDTPANIDPAMRAQMGVASDAAPTYPFELVTSQTEWDEIDRVVDFICALRGADKVNLMGWSSGGKRAGGYASLHPQKVDRLMIFACANYEPDGPSAPVRPVPYPGHAMMIQNREVGERQRWTAFLQRPDQVEPGVQDFVWERLMESDPVGAGWGPGVVRAPMRSYWGWNRQAVARVAAPTLLVVGESDRLMDMNHALFAELGARQKAFVTVANASHFMVWEAQHAILHEASAEWFAKGTFQQRDSGRFLAKSSREISALP